MKNSKLAGLKVALAHDFLNQLGGGEEVLSDLCAMFPEAPIFTLVYDEEATRGRFVGREICASYLDKWPRWLKVQKRKWLLPFCARAAESLDLRGFDLVIASANPWMKGLIVPQNTLLVAYCHAATRLAWDLKEEYLEELDLNFLAKFCAQRQLHKLRKWDQEAAWRPDYLIANSKATQARIAKYYRREAEVIYPGVELDFPKEEAGDYFFMISRLSKYKHNELAVKVCSEAGIPLKVAGSGPELENLKKLAQGKVEILGRVSEAEKKRLFAGCKGFVVLADDDFGITTVEANAAGKPVLAWARGGACELIQEGENGLFIQNLEEAELQAGLEKMQKMKWDADKIKQGAQKYSRVQFREELQKYLEKVWQEEKMR